MLRVGRRVDGVALRIVGAGFALLAIALQFAGCISDPTAPLRPAPEASTPNRAATGVRNLGDGPGFYPLAVGNRWHASRVFLFYGGGEYPETTRTSEDRAIIGTEVWADQTYFVEERTATQDVRPGEVFRSWTRIRQDLAGMYALYLCTCEPPLDANHSPITADTSALTTIKTGQGSLSSTYSRIERIRRAVFGTRDPLSGPPGGVTPDEILYLRYPLHVGQSWTREELTWAVEGVEILSTPAGKFPTYRIRLSHPSDSPEDFSRIWIGRAGRLAYHIHVVYNNGWIADEREIVDSIGIFR